MSEKLLDPNTLSLIRHNIHERGEALILFCRLNPQKHPHLQREYDKLYKNFIKWVPDTKSLQAKVTSDFKYFLAKKGLAEYFDDYFKVLISWPQRTPQVEAYQKILKIAREIEENQWSLDKPAVKLQKILDKYIKKYGWLYSRTELEAELKKVLPKNILAEIRNSRNQSNQIFIQREELTDKLNLPVVLKKELDALAELIYLEKYSQSIIQRVK